MQDTCWAVVPDLLINMLTWHACTHIVMQVGGEVARRARGLGMVVLAYDPYASEEKARAQGVRLVSFDEALEQGDFFSLHMPLTPGGQRCRSASYQYVSGAAVAAATCAA
jgi:hypothetical protein